MKPIMPVVLCASLVFGVAMALAEGPFRTLNFAKNPANLKGPELVHVPQIEAPDQVGRGEPFMVTVTVGTNPHPSTPQHNIHWIELYAGDVLIARTDLTPVLSRPTVTYTVTLEESVTLRARSMPNHSAAWESTKRVTVVTKKDTP